MGILRLRDVSDWQRASTEEALEILRNPDDAGPIGKRARTPAEHTATWIALDSSSGKLVYGAEIGIEVYRGHEKLLPESLRKKLAVREIRGWLFQVRKSGPTANPSSFALLEGKDILLSKLPHSRNYFVRRTLKPSKHEKAVWNRVARAWDKHPEIDLADERLDLLLQELSVTPFISSKDCRAAWAVTAKRFDVLGAERFDSLDDYTIGALEMPFQDACELLRTDPLIQEALYKTETGTVFSKYRSAVDVKVAIRHGGRHDDGALRRPVTEGLYQNRFNLVEAACWAALCGREVEDAEDSVAVAAVLLYHRFAYNFVDREKDPDNRSYGAPAAPVDRLAERYCEPQWSESFAQAELVREYTAKWRDHGYDTAVDEVTLLIDCVLRSTKDSIDDLFVNKVRPPLAGWPPDWKRPAGLAKALQRLDKLNK